VQIYLHNSQKSSNFAADIFWGMQGVADIVKSFEPISLAQMESVKLMNRIDTKYAVSRAVLPAILEAAKADYYVQEIDGKRIATYDTMYYDTESLDMYVRHHDRQLVRQKIRIRQYVDSDLTFLEIKRKNNKGRTKKKRITLPSEEVEYNDRNRPVRIKKYEWNENGTKAKQYNYLPNGKLFSVKVYEYIFSDK
jgi:hypothetical protein